MRHNSRFGNFPFGKYAAIAAMFPLFAGLLLITGFIYVEYEWIKLVIKEPHNFNRAFICLLIMPNVFLILIRIYAYIIAAIKASLPGGKQSIDFALAVSEAFGKRIDMINALNAIVFIAALLLRVIEIGSMPSILPLVLIGISCLLIISVTNYLGEPLKLLKPVAWTLAGITLCLTALSVLLPDFLNQVLQFFGTEGLKGLSFESFKGKEGAMLFWLAAASIVIGACAWFYKAKGGKKVIPFIAVFTSIALITLFKDNALLLVSDMMDGKFPVVSDTMIYIVIGIIIVLSLLGFRIGGSK